MNFLDKIIAQKKHEVATNKKLLSVQKLEQFHFFSQPCRSLKNYLLRPDKTGIIAEYKRKSPSQGIINKNVTLEEVTLGYEAHGASGMSILTDSQFFGGANMFLTAVKNFTNIPLLRKDFIIDTYQLVEAKAIGADIVLLIAECLSESEVKTLAAFAKSLGLEVLLEVHSEDQLFKLNEYVDVLGVNNRNLKTFETDIQTSERLLAKMPAGDYLKISESGIEQPHTIQYLKSIGYQGFLIGTYFMKQEKPQEAFAHFVANIQPTMTQI